jgi:curved DNA-binding protein
MNCYDLKEVTYHTQRTLTINSKNIRLTIPLGVEKNSPSNKITGHGYFSARVWRWPKRVLIHFTIDNHTSLNSWQSNLYIAVTLDFIYNIRWWDTVDTFDGRDVKEVA